MQALFEKYRPRTWDDVIGHEKVKIAVARMRDRGTLGGRAFMITGPSGTGKTTMAYLIASDVCDPENFIELDAGDVTPASVDQLERRLAYRAFGEKSGRAILINEVHGLRKDTVRKLLVTLERIPNHVCWVMTTTTEGQLQLFDGIDAHPLCSRCVSFEIDGRRYVKQFAERALEVAMAEGLGGATMREAEELVKRSKYNLRQVLSQIEAGELLREGCLA